MSETNKCPKCGAGMRERKAASDSHHVWVLYMCGFRITECGEHSIDLDYRCWMRQKDNRIRELEAEVEKLRERAEVAEERERRAMALVPEFETLVNNSKKYAYNVGCDRTSRQFLFVRASDIQRIVRAILRVRTGKPADATPNTNRG